MQTERVTFLTSPDHKAALEAFAVGNGMSTGHVVREATSRYIAEPAGSREEDEEALELALPELEAAVAGMRDTITSMRAEIERTCSKIDAVLAGERA